MDKARDKEDGYVRDTGGYEGFTWQEIYVWLRERDG
jgi:hypothetical protein